MNSAKNVQSMLTAWENQGLSKPEIVVNLANACIGWPYVYAGRGEYCNPQNRRSFVNAEYPNIIKKCQVLSNTKSDCIGCEWYPGDCVRFFDCRGFTYWLFRQVGITIKGGGASTQYTTDANWAEKGPISKMPRDKVCCAFRYDSKTKRYEHTLLYNGAGNYIHCSVEVKKTLASKYNATHYAIPKGLYDSTGGDVPLPTPSAGKAIVTDNRVALREGPSTSSRVITRINQGATVEITEIPADWEYIKYKGKEGFMMKKFLNEG